MLKLYIIKIWLGGANMNRVLNLLTYSFAVLGIITAVLHLLSELNRIKYVQISVIGFFYVML